MKPNRPLVIMDTFIPPGERTVLNLDIARLHTHSKVEIPVIIERAEKDGPVLLLIGGIHGNEVNGIEIIRSFISQKLNKPQAGTVICIPVFNVLGFLNLERVFPDGKDMNRAFPGTRDGSLASIFAWYLTKKILPQVDYCVDFHTGGGFRFNSSQVRISSDMPELLDLAKVFNPRFIVCAPKREKTFREIVTKSGKKILLFEGGKSTDIHNRITRRGTYGLLKLMHFLEMRDFSEELSAYSYPESIIIERSTWIRARHSGLFRFHVKDGAKVEKGDVIGSISDPYGNFEHHVHIPANGYIIGLNHAPVVYRGDALIHMGKPES